MCPEGGDADYLAAEARARREIDRMLADAGWSVEHLKDMNLGASLGVAAEPASVLLERIRAGRGPAKPKRTRAAGRS